VLSTRRQPQRSRPRCRHANDTLPDPARRSHRCSPCPDAAALATAHHGRDRRRGRASHLAPQGVMDPPGLGVAHDSLGEVAPGRLALRVGERDPAGQRPTVYSRRALPLGIGLAIAGHGKLEVDEIGIRSILREGQVTWRRSSAGDDARLVVSPGQTYRVRVLAKNRTTYAAVWLERPARELRSLSLDASALTRCSFRWRDGTPPRKSAGISLIYPDGSQELSVTDTTVLLTNRRFVELGYWSSRRMRERRSVVEREPRLAPSHTALARRLPSGRKSTRGRRRCFGHRLEVVGHDARRRTDAQGAAERQGSQAVGRSPASERRRSTPATVCA